MVCIRLLWLYITAVLREEVVWSDIHLVIHSGQACRSNRFLGSGLVGSLKMYHKLLGKAVRSVPGESETECIVEGERKNVS
jgi:hypothetical protein